MQFPNSTRRDAPHAQWADIESGDFQGFGSGKEEK